MYVRLMREYRIWLADILYVMHALCEGVVPAGRVAEEIYLETKILYRNAKSQKREEMEAALFRYALRGTALLHPVKIAVESMDEDGNEDGNENEVIRLRRTYATAILSSLQMLVNYAYLSERCNPEMSDEDIVFAQLDRMFEIGTHDEVKWVRSGSVLSMDDM